MMNHDKKMKNGGQGWSMMKIWESSDHDKIGEKRAKPCVLMKVMMKMTRTM